MEIVKLKAEGEGQDCVSQIHVPSQTRVTWRSKKEECKGRLAIPPLYTAGIEDAVERGEDCYPQGL